MACCLGWPRVPAPSPPMSKLALRVEHRLLPGEIYLSAYPAVLPGADRLGADLPGQIHLQGTINGHHPVKLTDIVEIVGLADRTQLNDRVVI